jgi:hypothetical protein
MTYLKGTSHIEWKPEKLVVFSKFKGIYSRTGKVFKVCGD